MSINRLNLVIFSFVGFIRCVWLGLVRLGFVKVRWATY